jgi:hypothetical protein
MRPRRLAPQRGSSQLQESGRTGLDAGRVVKNSQKVNHFFAGCNWVQRAAEWMVGLMVTGWSVDLQFGHEKKCWKVK